MVKISDLHPELISKYNVQGPRYTSYPTALKLRPVSDKKGFRESLKKQAAKPGNISLYFHIPFCYSLCWYCGCTKVITKNGNLGDIYLDYLDKEIGLVRNLIHPEAKVSQIHFGGGTPTFLSPEQLYKLGNIINSSFQLGESPEFGVEIDPRRCTEGHIIALAGMGCNRASIGVQDTNEEVQKAIHRIQPQSKNMEVISWLRKYGINSLNADLIYGLPKQSRETFQKTIEDVCELKPGRLAVYSYAHLPSRMPSQRLISHEDLPNAAEKAQMMLLAVDELESRGYNYIGMDHFSAKNDGLSLALQNGTLQRNFQGYSTCANTKMFGFGMSSISQAGDYFWQNEKNLGKYYKQVDAGEWPVAAMMKRTEDDRVRNSIIMNIMCKTEISLKEIESRFNIDFYETFGTEYNRLKELESDGLLQLQSDTLKITRTGRMFLRNIAMIFDTYLHDETRRRYSKTV